jgi:hypothetical protein
VGLPLPVLELRPSRTLPVTLLNETAKGKNGKGKQKLGEMLASFPLLYLFVCYIIIENVQVVVFGVATP